MGWAFAIAAAVAAVSTLLVVTRAHAVHALLYLVVSLLSVAVIFYLLGAPFVAALEVIIYAGAIVVLFVFVVIMLGLGPGSTAEERRWLRPRAFAGPALLAAVLLAEVLYTLTLGPAGPGPAAAAGAAVITPRELGLVLYGRYAIAVELASLVLLAAVVGAFHLTRGRPPAGEHP